MTPEVELEPCELLQWDTEHFGLRIGRVRDHRLGANRLREVLSWATDERIDCLYLLADGTDADTHRLAQAHGFRFVDVRLTLGTERVEEVASRLSHGAVVRPARSADIERLRALAADGFRDSRFYADGRFPPAAVDRLFERWLAGSLDGSLADLVLVVELSGEAAGYITARLDPDQRVGTIELVGTSHPVRRRGVGRALVASALAEFARAGMNRASVVTQGRNVAAQRLYQSCGFRTELVQVWYHHWADEQGHE